MKLKSTSFLKSVFILIAFSLITNSFSQVEKQYTSVDLPEWAKLMYKENADIGRVMTSYEKYYEKHDFIKNSHTQYYKRWLKEVQRGTLSPISRSEKEHQDSYIKQSISKKNTKSSNSQWKALGPFDYDEDAGSMSYAAGAAHVYTVEQSVSNSNVLYAGTATAGLWKSIDKGLNWTLKTQNLVLSSVYAIEIDRSNEEILYMGAADGRLWKSTNGGNTWNPLATNYFYQGSGRVQDIVLSPNNNNILFVLTQDGYFRSTNGGSSFSKLFSGEYQEIEFHTTNPNIVYAIKYNSNTTRTEFYKSTDNGITFTQKTSGWPAIGEQKRTEISVSADNPSKVYAYCTGVVNGSGGTYGLYVSTNQGDSWTFNCCGSQPGGAPSTSNKNLMGWSDQGTDEGGQYYYDLALGVMPNDEDKLFVGGVNLWHSSDGGKNFICPSKWSHSYKDQYVHADIHDIKIYGNEVWVANDGGIWYSNNAGTTFEKRFKGIQGTDFWGFGVGYGEQGRRVMVGGAYHNGTQIRNNDVYRGDWAVVHGGDGVGGHINPFDEKVYHGQNGAHRFPDTRTGSVVSLNFSKRPNNDYPLGKHSNVKYHPRNFNTVFVGEGTELWKSTNNGVTFNSLHNFGDHVADFEISTVNPNIMYAATYPGYWSKKKLFKSTNGGSNWTEVTLPSSLDVETSAPYDITLSGDNENELWIAKLAHYGTFSYELDGYKVFKSVNGASSWINLTTSTLNNEKVQTIVHQAGTDGGVYIGTGTSVYYRNDNMNDWQLFNNNLPLATSAMKLVPDYFGATIINASNRGVFDCDFYEPSNPIAQFGVSSNTTQCNSSSLTFIDQSVVSGNNLQRIWNFEGGISSSTSDAKVDVVYPLPGVYDVSLTVTDANGSHTVTYTDFIVVTGSCVSSTDLAITGIQETIQNPSCSNNGFLVNVEVQNFGTETVNSFDLDLYRNDELISSDSYSTSLSTGETEMIDLGFIQYVFGLKAVIKNVNGGIDNVSNNELNWINSGVPEIDNQTYSVVSVSSEQPNTATSSIDGDINTIWHSRWSTGKDPMPYELVYDLGQPYFLTQLNMVNRQNNPNGYLGQVDIYVSKDGINWGLPHNLSFEATTGNQVKALSGKEGRYVKVVINTTYNGDDVASIAEISFYGCDANVTSTKDLFTSNMLSVYPNPFNEFVVVKGVNGSVNIEVYNHTGSLVKQNEITEDTQFDMSYYPTGVYMIKVTSNNLTEVVRMVKL